MDGLVQTKNLSTFVVHEALAREDIDQSGDFGEDVVVVQDRESGQKLPLAADTHEGRGSVPGRPVARVRESPFSFYAVAAQDPADGSDGDVLAFLEPEGPHDINGDGDTIDTILRTFVRRGRDGGLESRTPIIAADAAPVVNGRSFALSKGMIFARISEAAGAPHRTTRISVSHSGGDADAASLHGVVAGNGRFVAFASDATNLTIDPDVPGTRDVFVRDLCVSDGQQVPDCEPRTERVSGEQGGDWPSISRDGRFIAYVVAQAGQPSSAVVAVHDRRTATTTIVGASTVAAPVVWSEDDEFAVVFAGMAPRHELYLYDAGRVSPISEPGFAASTPAFSGDGNFVAYVGYGLNGAPLCGTFAGHHYCFPQILVFDRRCVGPLSSCTELVSATAAGTPSVGSATLFDAPAISGDGRFVTFTSSAVDLPSFASSPWPRIWLRDRRAALHPKTTVVQGNGGVSASALSEDGRFIAVDGAALTDRLTGLVTTLGNGSPRPSLSGDGRLTAFETTRPASTLTDVFVTDVGGPHTVPRGDITDLSENGVVGETVLAVIDPASGKVEITCPATTVAVADGRAAFLRPESAGGGPNCPGSGDLNGDGDDRDEVVHLLENRDGSWQVTNLKRAATALAFSGNYVGALISEHDQAGVPGANPDLNDDGDESDAVVQVYALPTGRWDNVGEAASRIDASGDVVAYLATNPLGDGVLRIYHAPQSLLHGYDSAVDFVLAPGTNVDGTPNRTPLVAYRTREAAVCEEGGSQRLCAPAPPPTCADTTALCDLNRDGDCCDTILRAFAPPYDKVAKNSVSSAIACPFETCDPRVPYRVGKNTVTFLSLTAQNERIDMPAGANDIVVQTMDMRPFQPTIRVLGTVHAGTCSTDARACASDADCPNAGSCRMTDGCVLVGDSCDSVADCGALDPRAECRLSPITPGDQEKRCVVMGHGCRKDADCAHLTTGTPGVTATCGNGPESVRRLASLFTAPLGGAQFFTSVGHCDDDPGAACATDSDCGNTASSVCVLEPTVTTVSDFDGDEIPDVFDTCPHDPANVAGPRVYRRPRLRRRRGDAAIRDLRPRRG